MSFSAEFRRKNIPEPDTDRTRLFVFVSGTSESGKSDFTTRGYSQGYAHRIKYLHIANALGAEHYGNDDPFAYLQETNNPLLETNHSMFWKKLDQLTADGPRISVIETLKHPLLLRSMGNTAIDAKLLSIFIDADFEERVARESERLGVPVETIRKQTEQKDIHKVKLGLNQIRNSADIIVANNGSYDEFVQWSTELFESLSARFPSNNASKPIIYE